MVALFSGLDSMTKPEGIRAEEISLGRYIVRETIGERESPALVRVTVTIAPGQLRVAGEACTIKRTREKGFVAFRYFYFINGLAGLGAVCVM